MSETLLDLRIRFHKRLCETLLGHRGEVMNIADKSSPVSVRVADRMAVSIGYRRRDSDLAPQSLGKQFADAVEEFVRLGFGRLGHLRPGNWLYSVKQTAHGIADYQQYEHLKELSDIIGKHPEIRSALGGDYLITPDIVIGRRPVTDEEINERGKLIDSGAAIASRTGLRQANVGSGAAILHASISVKWTMRSDRSQNTRTEALNLIRNRKGRTPHVVVVTLEPLAGRLASIAFGTGDVDCVYHAALDELCSASDGVGDESQAQLLKDMIVGRRLRDVADLPFDLAV